MHVFDGEDLGPAGTYSIYWKTDDRKTRVVEGPGCISKGHLRVRKAGFRK